MRFQAARDVLARTFLYVYLMLLSMSRIYKKALHCSNSKGGCMVMLERRYLAQGLFQQRDLECAKQCRKIRIRREIELRKA